MKAKRKTKVGITRETVLAAVKGGATSLTAVYKACGGTGCVPGSTARKMRALVGGDLDAKLATNREAAKADGAQKPGKARKAPKPAPGGKPAAYPRHESNPFRASSSYGACYDILLAHPQGIGRAKLVEELARATGKERRKCYFDVTTVCSSRAGASEGGDGDGRSHRCIARAADSYYVERGEGGLLRLRLRDREW